MVRHHFADRLEVGKLVVAWLSVREFPENVIFLALPRADAPVGFTIAERSRLITDVVVVRKLGVPWQSELRLGAIAGSACVVEEQLIRERGTSNEAINHIVSREQVELRRREEIYHWTMPQHEIHNRSVILVDDGLATERTRQRPLTGSMRLNSKVY